MSKKDLASVTTNLAALARTMPTQNLEPAPLAVAMPRAGEPTTQFNLSMRKSLRKELQRLAGDADMTMRAFVLSALKEQGLAVTKEDLLDLRQRRWSG